MSGPVISGFLIHYFSWREIFLVTVPVSLGVFLVGWLFLVQYLPKKGGVKKTAFDWYGSLLWIILVTFAVVFISHANEVGTVQKIIGAIFFIIAAGLFWEIERRRNVPLVPFFLLRRKFFGIAMLAAALSFIVLFIVLILMPFFMDFVLRIPVKTIGYVMMAVPLTLFLVSPVSGWLYDIIGARFLTTTGLAICCLAVLLLCFLGPESTPLDIAWRLALLGTGQSVFLSPNTASVLAGIEEEYTGITSGMLATSRNIGMLSGVAIAGMFFTAFFSFYSGGLDLKEFSELQVYAFMCAFQSTLGIAAVLALVGGILSVLREERREN
jgi:MFS family permease